MRYPEPVIGVYKNVAALGCHAYLVGHNRQGEARPLGCFIREDRERWFFDPSISGEEKTYIRETFGYKIRLLPELQLV